MSGRHTILEEDVFTDRSFSAGRYGKAGIWAAATLMVVVTVAFTSTLATLTVQKHGMIGLDGMVVVKPAFENCAPVKDDCLSLGCCGPTGYSCFKTSATTGKCMRACTPGGLNGTCEGAAPPMKPAVEQPGLSLFCFSVYTGNTGSSKRSLELELLQMQHDMSASIFSCAEWGVYSDVVAPLGGDDVTTRVEDVWGDFHILKRKGTEFWSNSALFVQVWLVIRDEGHYKNHNWVVKADADAVFFPYRLINVLRDVAVPKEGIYMENCKYVNWGFFGNLEVFSQQAFATMVDNMNTCYASLPWKVGAMNGKFGPMGEDNFAQKCMDLLGVGRQENWLLTTDGACVADRPDDQKHNPKYIPDCKGVTTPSIHPFKKPDHWARCWQEATAA